LTILKVKLIDFIYANLLKGALAVLLFMSFLFFWYSRDLPSPDKIQRKEGFSTVILDRKGKPIYDIYSDKNRIPVPLSDIPDHLKKATVSIEDKDFYEHQGFSSRGILRAILNILTFKGLQGGSTLTQQLVKNVLLSSERTFPRKFKEFILAVQIERKYKKDEILQMYLNESPYGGTMWGIEAAAQGYFGKNTRELNFIESVILAGLPQRPSYYSPYGAHPDAFRERAKQVLRRMREDGIISSGQEEDYIRQITAFKFAPNSGQLAAPHFVEYVKKKLIEKFGEEKIEKGGYKVVTTLDLTLQKKSEAIIYEELNKIKQLNVTNGAAMAMDPTSGEILSYVGSREYESEDEDFQGKFDVVSLGKRQPGSALKPITYAVAFSKNYTPSTVIMDVETKFPGGIGKPDYIPKNYDNKFRGPVQLRFALGNSINLPAVKLTALVGIRDILETAHNMGIKTLEPTKQNESRLGLSITLGGGEVTLFDLTSAYSVFATGGVKNEPVVILKVTDASGKTVFEHKKTDGKRILSEEVSFLVSHILLDNNARKDVFGERSYLNISGKTVAVKTGTTDDKRDNWTVGYTPDFTLGVWVGNNDNSEMDPRLASGATGAAPIWNRIMREYLSSKANKEFAVPANIISLNVDAFGGGLPKDGRPERSEYFIAGTEPTATSPIYKKLKLSRSDTGKLANNVEIATGNYEEKDFIVFEETDPTSNEENRWQQAIDEWQKSQPDPIYHPPSEISSVNQDAVVVRIRKPSEKERIDNNNVEISAEARAVKNIRKLELYIDGEKKDESSGDRLEKNINLPDGIHKIKVTATDEQGKTGDSEITVGINADPEQLTVTPAITEVPVGISPTPS